MKYFCVFALSVGCSFGQCPKLSIDNPWSEICNVPVLVKALCAPTYVLSQFKAVHIAANNVLGTRGFFLSDQEFALRASIATTLQELRFINPSWCEDCLVDGWNGYNNEYQPYPSRLFNLLRNLQRTVHNAVIMISLNQQHCK